MEDYNQRIQILKTHIQQQLNKPNTNVCVSVSALYEDTAQNIKICTASMDMAEIENAINQVLHTLPKSIKLQVVIYNGKREGKDTIQSSNIIELPDRGAKETSSSVPREITDLLSKFDQILQKNEALNGIVNDEKQSNSKQLHQDQITILELKHEVALDNLKREIAEKNTHIAELEAEVKEAADSLEKFEEMYGREQKMESGARTTTAILRGILSVAPGLVKYASNLAPGLGGLAGALVDDNGGAGAIAAPSAEGQPPKNLQAMQRVMLFMQALSDEEIALFLAIITAFENDKSTLSGVADLVVKA